MTKSALAEDAKNVTFDDVDALAETDASGEDLIAMLVEAEICSHGETSSEPCSEAMVLIEGWADGDKDSVANLIQMWRGACARREVAKPLVVEDEKDEPELINHALIKGEATEGQRALLKQTVVFMTGDLYEQGNRNNTRDGDWKRNEMTWGQLLLHPKSPLTNHHEAKRKEGTSIVLAETLDGKRNANSVDTMYAMVIDVDSGADMYEVIDKLEAEGILAVVYSSFNHGKEEISLKHDDIIRKMKLDDTPTRRQIQEYLRSHHKDRYDEAFIQSIEVVDARRHTGDGTRTILSTPALDKFRVVLPLKDPIKLTDLGATTDKYKEVWANKVTGFVLNTLGVNFDSTSCDVNRLFYLPRHKKGAEWDMALIQGDPLDYDSITPASKDAYVKDRSYDANDPFAYGGESEPDEVKQYETPSGTSLNALHSRVMKERLLLPQLLEAECPEKVRRVVSEGKIEIECPFEAEHSSEGGTGTVVMDPMTNQYEVWTVSCPHDACQGRHKLEFLEEMLKQGWFDEALIKEGSAYLLPSNVPDDLAAEDLARGYIRKHLLEAGSPLAICDATIAGAKALLIEHGLTRADALERVDAAVQAVQRQMNNRDADKNFDPVAAARTDAGDQYQPPNSLLAPLYDEALVDAEGFIVKPGDAPEKYREYGIVPTDDDAYTRMRLEIRDQMYLSLRSRFDYVVLDGEAKLAIRPASGQSVRLMKDATLGKLYVNRSASYEGEDANGKKTIKQLKPLDVFLYARQRKTFVETCFEPDATKANAATSLGSYNLWNGFAVKPSQGDWSLLRDHIKYNLCGGDSTLFNFVMTWLASLFARPGEKVQSSLAVIGEQGTGKSKVFDWIRRGIGSAALKVSSMRHLSGNFNAHLDGLILLVCEEAFWGGNKSEGGVIKDLISSDTLQIEGKFKDLVARPNYVNMVFISNNKWTVPVDGEDARRFLVLACSDAKKKDAAYFGAIDDQMENGGLEAMVHELTHWDPASVGLTWNDLRYPPVTDALREQAGMGLTGPAERLVSMLETGVITGRMGDGETFRYALDDEMATEVARHHMVAALHPNGERGNLSQEVKDAIRKFLGDSADQGDKKMKVSFLGSPRHDDGSFSEHETDARVRYFAVPPLQDVQETLERYGRG